MFYDRVLRMIFNIAYVIVILVRVFLLLGLDRIESLK